MTRAGTQDVHGHDRGQPVRADRRADHRAARAGHCQQLRHVLLARPGARQVAQEASARLGARTGQAAGG